MTCAYVSIGRHKTINYNSIILISIMLKSSNWIVGFIFFYWRFCNSLVLICVCSFLEGFWEDVITPRKTNADIVEAGDVSSQTKTFRAASRLFSGGCIHILNIPKSILP